MRTIATEDRIDRYILGNMSDSEKAEFEKDLARDPELREDYDNQVLIAKAIRSVNVRQILEDAEQMYQEDLESETDRYVMNRMSLEERNEFEKRMKEDSEVKEKVELHSLVSRAVLNHKVKEILVECEEKHDQSRVINTSTLFERVRTKTKHIYTIAAAACIALVANVGISIHQISAYISSSQACIAELVPVISKGGDEVESALSDAYEMLSEGDKDALNTIDNLLALITEQRKDLESIENDIPAEEYQYNLELLDYYEGDAHWYKAIYYMQHHKVHKAKEQLKLIADSGGRYSEEAKSILEENRIF